MTFLCRTSELPLRQEKHETLFLWDSPKAILPHGNFSFETKDFSGQCTLRLTGETEMPPEYRCEPKFPLLYRKLDDRLIFENGEWVLCLDAEGETFERACMCMYRPKEDLKGAELCLRCPAELSAPVDSDAEVFVRAQFYYGEPYSRACYQPADAEHTIHLNRVGNSEYVLEMPVEEQIDFIFLKFSVRRYRGRLAVHAPALYRIDGGKNERLTPSFAPSSGLECGPWVGDGFSLTEWPAFRVLLNGEEIFSGRRFQRIYHNPAYEFPIPVGAFQKGNNRFEIRYEGTGKIKQRFLLKSVEMVSVPERPRVAAYRKYVMKGKSFRVLIAGSERPEVCVEGAGITFIRYLSEQIFGYSFAEFIADSVEANIDITFRFSCGEERIRILRVVERGEDCVVTGTGDSIYIGQNEEEFSQFLAWYAENDLGDYITFRPVYRWSGATDRDRALWRNIVRFCEDYGLQFCHMLDGRELNGCNANPPEDWLKSDEFLGVQAHEKDGSFCYWQENRLDRAEETFCNAFSQKAERMGILTRRMPIYSRGKIFRYFDNEAPLDMKGAHDALLENLKQIPRDATRHTGVTTFFHLFYEAGVEMLGAELMYGPQEIILGALRGASRAYGKETYASHLAMQWYCTPHDTPEHAKRYALSLYLSYLHGVRQINTEEGLWRLEEGFAEHERFSEACGRLVQVQQNFNRFVRTHTRRGHQLVRTAAIQGKYDGWSCFGREFVYGRRGEEFAFGAPEESWDLLRVFFPDAVLDAIYRHPCPRENIGLASRVPYALVDIVPESASLEMYDRAFMLGYNTCTEEQAARFAEFVRRGGTLVLGACHLNAGTSRTEALARKSALLDCQALRDLLGLTKISREEISAGEAEPDSEIPGVLVHEYGKGRVYFVESDAFPAETQARETFIRLLRRLGEEDIRFQPRGSVRAEGCVSTARYRCAETDVHYLLNVAWWTEEPQRAVFRFGKFEYGIDVCGYDPVVLTAGERYAVSLSEPTAEILSLSEEDGQPVVSLQADGPVCLEVFCADSERRWTIRAGQKGICKLKLSEGK